MCIRDRREPSTRLCRRDLECHRLDRCRRTLRAGTGPGARFSMTLKTTLRLTVLGLAGYGGRTLWNEYGSLLATRVTRKNRSSDSPSRRRNNQRSELTVEE